MQDPDSFRIAQFAKELVSLRISKLEDPCAVAAALVLEAARTALKSRPGEAERVVSDVCYGGLQALLLARHDLSRGAALMLAAVEELAYPLGRDRAELRGYALEGFARMRRLVTQGQLIDMLDTLECRFPGTGAAFAAALAEQPHPGRREVQFL